MSTASTLLQQPWWSHWHRYTMSMIVLWGCPSEPCVNIVIETKLRPRTLTEIWWLGVFSNQVTMALYCQATQADKSCCTTKLSVLMYILKWWVFSTFFFHSDTDGFSNLLPMTYEMLHQQAATIYIHIYITFIPVIVLFAVCKCNLESRTMNMNRDRVLCQPKLHQNYKGTRTVSFIFFLTQTFLVLCWITLFCSDSFLAIYSQSEETSPST